MTGRATASPSWSTPLGGGDGLALLLSALSMLSPSSSKTACVRMSEGNCWPTGADASEYAWVANVLLDGPSCRSGDVDVDCSAVSSSVVLLRGWEGPGIIREWRLAGRELCRRWGGPSRPWRSMRATVVLHSGYPQLVATAPGLAQRRNSRDDGGG